jgi:hypothetical protein
MMAAKLPTHLTCAKMCHRLGVTSSAPSNRQLSSLDEFARS